MSLVPVAPPFVEPLVLRRERCARAVLHGLQDRVEYVRDPRPVSGMRAPMALDAVSALRRVVLARGLVRERKRVMTRCMLMLALALTPGLASAQDTTQQWPGLSTSELSTVYVLDDTGAETSGKLVRLNPDSIVILADGGERRFDAARIRRVQKRGDSIRNGVIIGAVVGAVLGGISAGIADCPGVDQSCAGARAGMFVVSTSVYTAIGAGIDALVVGRTTLYTAAPARSGRLPGASAGSPSIGIGVRFHLPIGLRH